MSDSRDLRKLLQEAISRIRGREVPVLQSPYRNGFVLDHNFGQFVSYESVLAVTRDEESTDLEKFAYGLALTLPGSIEDYRKGWPHQRKP